MTKPETGEPPTLGCLKEAPRDLFSSRGLDGELLDPTQSSAHHATWATFPSCSRQKQDALLPCPVRSLVLKQGPSQALRLWIPDFCGAKTPRLYSPKARRPTDINTLLPLLTVPHWDSCGPTAFHWLSQQLRPRRGP